MNTYVTTTKLSIGTHWREEQRRHLCRRRRARARARAVFVNVLFGVALGILLSNVLDLVR